MWAFTIESCFVNFYVLIFSKQINFFFFYDNRPSNCNFFIFITSKSSIRILFFDKNLYFSCKFDTKYGTNNQKVVLLHCFKTYLCENLDVFIDYVYTASENYFHTESFSFSQLSADSDGFLNCLERAVNISISFVATVFYGNI